MSAPLYRRLTEVKTTPCICWYARKYKNLKLTLSKTEQNLQPQNIVVGKKKTCKTNSQNRLYYEYFLKSQVVCNAS